MAKWDMIVSGVPVDLHYQKAKISDNVTLHFTLVTAEEIPDLLFPFSLSEISSYSKEDWESIHTFIANNSSKMLEFSIKCAKHREEAEDKQRMQDEIERRSAKKCATQSSGFVYLLLSTTGHYKIGKAINIDNRILRLETGLPVSLQLVGSFHSNYYSKAERHVHKFFEEKHIKGEWFDLSKSDVETFLAIKDDELDYLFTF